LTTAVAITESITLSRYLNQSDSEWWHGGADHHEVYCLRPYVTLPFACYSLPHTIQTNTPLAVENTECRDTDQHRSDVCSAQFRLHDEEVRRSLNAREGRAFGRGRRSISEEGDRGTINREVQ